MNEKEYLSALLEEYRSLRDESKQASINMYTALQWGMAAIGIVIAGAFSQWGEKDKGMVVLLIFFIFVPVLSSTTLFLILGEATRFKRVGDYICFIEQKVGILFDSWKNKEEFKKKWDIYFEQLIKSLGMVYPDIDMSDPLAWEQWLRNMKGKSPIEGHIGWIYKLRLVFFASLMVISWLIGLYYTQEYNYKSWWIGIIAALSIASMIFVLLQVYNKGLYLEFSAKSFRRDKVKYPEF